MPPIRAPSPRPEHRPASAVPLGQALAQAPVLRELGARISQSADCLEQVRPLLPASLRTLVRPGPIEDGVWCLLVPGPAAAAKIRQLLPALVQQLAAAGLGVHTIRLSVPRNR
ncbi:MAG TPA: DciA family protein [Ottowia sp.]|uniref:DciA family protein n=1 Tax=Ottowia sp. TaxID=1898956 RepID=UPI002C73A672|nr:DciA family protein [Ottowia sp.]HMN19878.1 DciA family protein [Ottowia sp.]